jgi:hypothetical protein
MQGKKMWGKEEIATASSVPSVSSGFKASSFNTETTIDEGLTTWNISWTQFVIAEIQFQFDNEGTDT